MKIKKLEKCPHCTGKNIIPIAYGYPSFELLEDSKAGKVKLGGCCIVCEEDPETGEPVPVDPQWYCKDCEEKLE